MKPNNMSIRKATTPKDFEEHPLSHKQTNQLYFLK
jgi:hypothetical protein